MQSRFFALCIALISSWGPILPAAASDLDGIVKPCGENQICAWFKTKATPPAGWAVDEDWTQRYEAVVMFHNGDTSEAAPMMYVRTHVVEDGSMSVEDYAHGAQDSWLAKVQDSTIEPQPDLNRDGKPPLKVFLYRNPSVPEQAFELTAFTKDRDPSHDNATYFQQAVLIAPSMGVLEKARPAFEDLLKRL